MVFITNRKNYLWFISMILLANFIYFNETNQQNNIINETNQQNNIIIETNYTINEVNGFLISDLNNTEISYSTNISSDIYVSRLYNSYISYNHQRNNRFLEWKMVNGITNVVNNFTFDKYNVKLFQLHNLQYAYSILNSSDIKVNLDVNSKTISSDICIAKRDHFNKNQLIFETNIKSEYYLFNNFGDDDKDYFTAITLGPIISIESFDGSEYGISGRKESGYYIGLFKLDQYFHLEPIINLNSSTYNLKNTRFEIFDVYINEWVEQDNYNIILNNPNYKIRIYNNTNQIIFEDSEYQKFEYIRHINI